MDRPLRNPNGRPRLVLNLAQIKYFYRGMSIRTVARMLRVSEGTIRNRLKEIRKTEAD